MSEKKKATADPALIVSSRIRLARNWKKYPFPSRLSAEQSKEMKDALREIFREYPAEEFDFLDMKNVSEIQAGAMMEEHLISPEFARARAEKSALLLGRDRCLSVMVNEEDHLRIQALSAEADLKELYGKISALDDYLSGKTEYAFLDKYGYLTACPTNLGTGMRASVMMHLPALTQRGLIGRLVDSVAQLGVTVRGLYGEGTQAGAALYQVSNSVSLGIKEEETLELLEGVVAQICEAEHSAREECYPDPASQEELYRAYGILKECRLISSSEFRTLYSRVRLAAELGLLSPDLKDLDRLFTECQPYQLMLSGNADEESRRDLRRASLIRERLKND